MYSYEDRIKAVKLYIKLGHKSSAVKRILGYPTKKYIRRWYLRYMEEGDLPKDYIRPPHFTSEQKQQAVEHYFKNGRCGAFTMKALGYPCRAVLNRWLDECDDSSITRNHTKRSVKPFATQEQQKHAVIDFCLREGSAQSVATNVGVSRQMLYKWKDKLLSQNYSGSMKEKTCQTEDVTELEQKIEELQRDMHKMQLEHDILKKANELLKKDQGISHQRLTNREKTVLIDALYDKYCLKELLNTVELPRSSYFYHKARLKLPDKYVQVRESIKDIFTDNHHCYGYRRIQAEIRKSGIRLAEKVIRRLMQEEQLIPHSSCKRRRYNSYYGEISPPANNMINRDFQAQAPNTKWLTDISEFQIPAGKIYLSPIVDCFDGMIVSWKLGKRPTAELVNTMLDDAIDKLHSSEQPIVHSDRGAHYRWPGWIERTDNAGLTRSMSRKGCSPDNAACEGFFGRLKTEFFYPKNWTHVTLDQLIYEIDNYIKWYNQKRIKISLGARSPTEYRLSLGYAV